MISNKLTFSLTIISLLLALMVFNVNAYDYPGNGWSHSANVIINTSATGLSADVSNYPLLIRLNSSNFDFNLAQSDGDDIRFTLSDGFTVVKYEKEMWDAIGQNAEIWVKIPVVYEDNSDQYIIMYWGNPSVSTQSYGPYVFERSNNFTAVYHMTDIDDVDDATENNPGGDYDGTNCGTAKVTGVIGNAFSFNGSDHIDIPGGVFSNISSQITVELWQYGDPAIQPQADRILWGLDSYGCRAINIIIPWDNGDIVFDAGNSGGYFSRIEKNTTNSSDYEGQWNHWTFIKNTSTGEMRMYLNGTEYYGEGSGNTYSINVNSARIGADHNGYQNYDGYLDEFRFSKVARSASWIKLSYESQKSNQSVVTIESISSQTALTIDNTNNSDKGSIYIVELAEEIRNSSTTQLQANHVYTIVSQPGIGYSVTGWSINDGSQTVVNNSESLKLQVDQNGNIIIGSTNYGSHVTIEPNFAGISMLIIKYKDFKNTPLKKIEIIREFSGLQEYSGNFGEMSVLCYKDETIVIKPFFQQQWLHNSEFTWYYLSLQNEIKYLSHGNELSITMDEAKTIILQASPLEHLVEIQSKQLPFPDLNTHSVDAINLSMKIINNGTSELALSDITLKYFMWEETLQPEDFKVDAISTILRIENEQTPIIAAYNVTFEDYIQGEGPKHPTNILCKVTFISNTILKPKNSGVPPTYVEIEFEITPTNPIVVFSPMGYWSVQNQNYTNTYKINRNIVATYTAENIWLFGNEPDDYGELVYPENCGKGESMVVDGLTLAKGPIIAQSIDATNVVADKIDASSANLDNLTVNEDIKVEGDLYLGTDPSIKWTGHHLHLSGQDDHINVVNITGAESEGTIYPPRIDMWKNEADHGTSDESQRKRKIVFDAGEGPSWIELGNVGIGTQEPTAKLDVEGEIKATSITVDDIVEAKGFKVGEWVMEAPDYVFQKSYYLRPLKEVEAFIKKNKHLPEIQSAKDMKKDGVLLSELNMTLLKKIEELTLYVIDQNKKIEKLEKDMEKLNK